jgi:hypothetical protein
MPPLPFARSDRLHTVVAIYFRHWATSVQLSQRCLNQCLLRTLILPPESSATIGSNIPSKNSTIGTSLRSRVHPPKVPKDVRETWDSFRSNHEAAQPCHRVQIQVFSVQAANLASATDHAHLMKKCCDRLLQFDTNFWDMGRLVRDSLTGTIV